MKNYILTFETENDAELFFIMLDGKNNPDITRVNKTQIKAKLGYNPSLVENYCERMKIVKVGFTS